MNTNAPSYPKNDPVYNAIEEAFNKLDNDLTDAAEGPRLNVHTGLPVNHRNIKHLKTAWNIVEQVMTWYEADPHAFVAMNKINAYLDRLHLVDLDAEGIRFVQETLTALYTEITINL